MPMIYNEFLNKTLIMLDLAGNFGATMKLKNVNFNIIFLLIFRRLIG
jgi:hypothetical protein